ncbi:MAG: dephospho-CoA kinase, partial [Candidatus Omnitrophota bacterium]
MTAKLIGITGGFGSGKSAVAGFLRESGEEVLDADRIAHEALEKDSPAHPALARLFSDALDVKTGAFDKEKIAAVVFSDAEKRRRAEAVLHP